MKSILVIGATGAMGRYVIKHLSGWKVRAFTRNTHSQIAQSLVSDTVELFQGNTDNPGDIRAALHGMDALFINTDFWTNTKHPDNERQQMLQLLAIANSLNIAQVVFSSLENCVSLSNGKIPVTHFDSKAMVEQEINWQRSLEHFHKTPGFYRNNVTVLRTLPYFENLMSFFPPQQKVVDGETTMVFRLPIGDAPFSMVALDDIGWFTRHILEHPETFAGQTLNIGSDAVTGVEMAAQFEQVTGIKASYNPMSDEEFLASGDFAHDALNHFRFHREVGMQRDHVSLRHIHPHLKTFRAWLTETGWRGENRLVQKKLAE
ncbi:hypothetical protein OJHNALOF_01267 [Oceanimonas sp. MB9]|nr:hypothetical protein [Oceanimonas sp. MB9]